VIHAYDGLVSRGSGLHTLDGRWNGERIVLSHGTIVEPDGKRRFLEGYRALGV
jgi:hypothetical protein